MSSSPIAIEQNPSTRQNGFDAGKLRNSIKQRERKSLMSKSKPAKLTPAEIRSLNHNTSPELTPSTSRRGDRDSPSRQSPFANLSPLSTSTTGTASVSSSSDRHSNLRTREPTNEGRGSATSNRRKQGVAAASSQATHLANIDSALTPSVASYRGIATLRDPEVAKTASLTMLEQPAQQIVANPLSNFSRPRQSILTSSNDKMKSDRLTSPEVLSPVPTKDRTRSLAAISRTSSRQSSPIRPSDSPVSADGGRFTDKSIITAGTSAEDTSELPIPPIPAKGGATSSLKQKLSWRKTLTGGSLPVTDQDKTALRRESRRRTLMPAKSGYSLHAIHYDDTRPGEAPSMKESLKNELPSSKTSEFKESEEKDATKVATDFDQHPAVRPFSIDQGRPETSSPDSTSLNSKGKERAAGDRSPTSTEASSLSSMPTYARCSCCGKVNKPGHPGSEPSPVIHNENLRTNFVLETENTSARRRRSTSINSQNRRHVPIVPMQTMNGEIHQARIEPEDDNITAPMPQNTVKAPPVQPMSGVAINKPGDIIGPSSTPLAIMPRRYLDPRLVRFASLHQRDPKGQDKRRSEVPSEAQTVPPIPARFGSLRGSRTPQRTPPLCSTPGETVQPMSGSFPPDQYSRSVTPPQAPYVRPHVDTDQEFPLTSPVERSIQPQNVYQADQVHSDDQLSRHTSTTSTILGQPPQRTYHKSLSYSEPLTAAGKPTSRDILEKPAGGDSPTQIRDRRDAKDSIESDDDIGIGGFDVSSLDGTFVQRSLSRRAVEDNHGFVKPTRVSTAEQAYGVNSLRDVKEEYPAGGEHDFEPTMCMDSDGNLSHSAPTSPVVQNVSIPARLTSQPKTAVRDLRRSVGSNTPHNTVSSITDSIVLPAPVQPQGPVTEPASPTNETPLSESTLYSSAALSSTIGSGTDTNTSRPATPSSFASAPVIASTIETSRPTTVVRIVPTTFTADSSRKSILKLGDWVLPETPMSVQTAHDRVTSNISGHAVKPSIVSSLGEPGPAILYETVATRESRNTRTAEEICHP